MDADRRLTFDGFALDLANEQLVCDGEVVALTPKPFAVLRRLLEDGGQLVTRDSCFENHLRTRRRPPAPQTPWSGLHRGDRTMFLPGSASCNAMNG